MSNSPKNLRIVRNLGSKREQPKEAAQEETMQQQDTSQDEQPEATPDLSPREEIELIKRENLTGRQLRIARRMAQRHNLSPTSDLDAVRLLRKMGIDPFKKLDELNPAASELPTPANQASLPATVRKRQVPQKQSQPQPQQPSVIDDSTRQQEIRKIQTGLVRRRRKRLGLMLVKLVCYVMLPTIIAGYYYYRIATPMYATYSEFVIQSSQAPGLAGGGGLFSGSPLENVTDSITVQGYLTSRDAMLRLDEDLGFRDLFQNENVDVLQRLPTEASNEDAYKVYKKHVIIGFDPTEGVIKMEIITPSPESSLALSEALIGYAEERVDNLTVRLREDQMKGAREIFDEAEEKMDLAFDEVAKLQRAAETLDSESEAALVYGQISELEAQILTKRLELARLTANSRPNATKVRVIEEEIELLKTAVVEKRTQLSQGQEGTASLVDLQAELDKAKSKLLVRQEMLATSMQNLESARVEANRQTRYISRGVSPVTPDKASYPRAFENTLLAFVVFAGIYLMLSLTVSVLREQVTT